jgi:putative spermidine/putrescine transport system substrate-binding protein
LGRPSEAGEYKGQVALAGDPRASNQAILGVYAAGMANGGGRARNRRSGPEVLQELNKAGNFVPVIGKSGTLAQGTTPIVIAWDYNALAGATRLNGNPPVEVVVPKTGVLAGVYVQAISAFAPHPNAAKLWMEYLYSDEGQIGWLKGYCHPIRFNDLVAKKARCRRNCSTSCRRRSLCKPQCSRPSRNRAPTRKLLPSRLGRHRRRQRRQ